MRPERREGAGEGEAGRRARRRRATWSLWAAELVGTALLVGAGCSLVILDFGAGSPVARLVESEPARRAITGFLFGSVGALIALSPLGRTSGAHINPAVTLAFWLLGRMKGRVAAGYVVAQLAGGVIGGLALRVWGAMGASVQFAATLPGPSGAWPALLGEAAATFCLVAALFHLLGHARLRAWAPALFPPLYALLVWLEAPLSGASTNPARTLGPGLAAMALEGQWIYWLGPFIGTLAGLATLRAPWARRLEVRVAKVFHFAHDPHGLFADVPRPPGPPRQG